MLDFHTVYRVQMRNKGCKGHLEYRMSVLFSKVRMHDKGGKGHLEFRIASGNGGTGTCRRGADEHGCEFAPVAETD